MIKTFSDLPGWNFFLEETSANVYRVVGSDEFGHSVDRIGTDLEKILEECRRDAKEILEQKKMK